MRLLVLSDLHLELGASLTLPPGLTYDVVVLAGDIHSPGAKAVHWAQRESTFAGKPVVYVHGNHEFYGREMTSELEAMRAAAECSNVHLLERSSVVIDGVRFLGCMLWTDFQLPVQQADGSREVDVSRALAQANRCMNDFRLIEVQSPAERQRRAREFRRVLRAEDTLAMHWVDRDWLRRQLAEPFDGPTVVISHHAPAIGSVAEQFAADWLTPAFVSDLPDSFFEVPVLWVHGHTHSPFDYLRGGCRVVSNPRGYRMRDGLFENGRFNAGFIVEVSATFPVRENGAPVKRAELDDHLARLAERADMVPIEDAARLLGGDVLAAIEQLHSWWASRCPRVIAFSHPRLGLRFPRWQFEQRIWPVVQELSLALDATSPAALLSWLETPLGALDGRTPKAALEQGELAERVLALAGSEGL